jgi:hypothetical protein
VQCNIQWFKNYLQVNELPIDFLNFILQEILTNPGNVNHSNNYKTAEKNFSEYTQRFHNQYDQIRIEINKAKKNSNLDKTINEETIKRNVTFESVPEDIDRFLFCNLRQIKHLDLMLFQEELQQKEGLYKNLKLYISHIVRNSTEFINFKGCACRGLR